MPNPLRKLKALFTIATCLLPLVALAGSPEKLWSLSDEAPPAQKPADVKPIAPVVREQAVFRSSGGGNLPTAYLTGRTSGFDATNSVTVVPASNQKSRLSALPIGSELDIAISHSIIAFPDEAAPVIGKVRSGVLQGAKLLGESRLEPNSQRIFITFKTLSLRGKAYNFKAIALTSSGQSGFDGEYHSREAGYFTGDFISSFAAAYFDSLVPRSKNVFGQVQEDSSVDSSLKKGLAGGAMATAERFKDKLKKVPEFSELQGPITARAIVSEQAIEI